MRQVVADMAACTRIPIIAKPNAGLPYLDRDGNSCYSMGAEEFAEEMAGLAGAGASILGGCCGTTPEYIRRIRETFGKDEVPKVPRRPEGLRLLASERRMVSFGLDGSFFIVGERINPTGKKLLQAQLREGNFDKVLQFAQEQERDGAQILDVNMGMGGIDEKAMMLTAIEEVSGVTDLPLSLDSSHVDVLEAALRRYPGRALVNSVSLEKEKYEKLLPLVKKYGAMFILLPLSDKGLPATLEEKNQIIETVLARAYALGLEREDVVVDGLVSTVGANKRAALETLETIRSCRARGLATICGLSNISFGMPERGFVNMAFLALAVREGLTMAIANPSQELLMGCALATDLLLAKEGADLRYIERMGQGGKPAVPAGEAKALAGKSCREVLRGSVLKGNRGGIAAQAREALAQGEDASALLHEALLPAIQEVGELFDTGKYFLPQLIASAEAMKNAIEVLEPFLRKDAGNAGMPAVVIATVEGDIHDIGKNLVALMLRNYGFRVIDLGKDVPKEKIIQAAREHDAKIIALSALMTTTMRRMREVIEYAKAEGIGAKVMVGGAAITRDYAAEIGADGYSADAAEAVKLAKRLVSAD